MASGASKLFGQRTVPGGPTSWNSDLSDTVSRALSAAGTCSFLVGFRDDRRDDRRRPDVDKRPGVSVYVTNGQCQFTLHTISHIEIRRGYVWY